MKRVACCSPRRNSVNVIRDSGLVTRNSNITGEKTVKGNRQPRVQIRETKHFDKTDKSISPYG